MGSSHPLPSRTYGAEVETSGGQTVWPWQAEGEVVLDFWNRKMCKRPEGLEGKAADKTPWTDGAGERGGYRSLCPRVPTSPRSKITSMENARRPESLGVTPDQALRTETSLSQRHHHHYDRGRRSAPTPARGRERSILFLPLLFFVFFVHFFFVLSAESRDQV
ncbi:hypothetical protein IE53DRAFT_160117 [Violaceomyces palustris]|uniref:Uncharacterized protein n=1 Tax=Violaceomyces palustris TaxID=1673888 RepID=A0ACD0NTQ8_9BASI|nr:hypothetical protein IE53DRAFT_160117 [Violaceomyces palustris]